MQKQKNEKLGDAVKIVNEAIQARTDSLRRYLETTENDPVMLEGETIKGYYCQMMVNPQHVAQIMLGYDYPMYDVLGEDVPSKMWDDIAAWFGLGSVSSVDI